MIMSLLLSIVVLILSFIFSIYQKRRVSILSDIMMGKNCYSCKKRIHDTDEDYMTHIVAIGYDFKYTMCDSCIRHKKLIRLKSVYYRIKPNLNEFLIKKYDKKSPKIFYISLGFILLAVVLSFVFDIFWIMLVLIQLFVMFVSIIMYYRSYLTTIKKTPS